MNQGLDLAEYIVGKAGKERMIPLHSLLRIYSITQTGPDPSKRVVFTGHSMGACLSAVLAYQIIMRYPEFAKRLLLIQFGSPNYARDKFTQWCNLTLKSRIIQ